LLSLSLYGRDLTALPLSTLPTNNQLQKLVIGFNKITNLDLGSVPQLQQLFAEDNPLATIKITNGSQLKSVFLGKAPINTSLLHDLNALPALKELSLGITQELTGSLAMPNLTNLELFGDVDGAGLVNLPSLETLSLQDGLIVGIGNIQLERLKKLQISSLIDTGTLSLPALSSLKEIEINSTITKLDTHNANALTAITLSNYNNTTLDLSKTNNLASLNLNAEYIKEGGLKLPAGITNLSLSNGHWDSLDIAHLKQLESLQLTRLYIQNLDLSPFNHLNNLSLENIYNLQSLDLTPIANMTGFLTMFDTGVVTLKATGLQKVAGSVIVNNHLDDSSKANIEKLLGQNIFQ
jgi:hypothetical protein